MKLFKKSTMKTQQNNKLDSAFKRNDEPEPNTLTKNATGLLDLILPDCIEEGKDYIYLGPERYARTYVISVYPSDIYMSFFQSFFNLGQISMSIYLEPADTGDVIKKLTKMIVKLKAHIRLENERTEPDYEKIQQAEDFEMLRASLQRNLEKILYAQVFITIYADSLEKLKEKCEEFRSRCEAYNMRPKALTFEQLKGYMTTLPLGRQLYINDTKTMTTGAAACCVPTGNTEVYYEGGVFLGYNLTTGSPVFYNQFADSLPGPHIAIFGTIGSGKSTTMKIILARSAAFGFWAAVLDPEGEYKKLINMLGGKYIEVKAGGKAGINPFDLEVEEDEGKRFLNIEGKISEIRFLLGIISESFVGKRLDGIQLAIIERVVRKLYSDYGITTDPASLYTDMDVDESGQIYIGKIKKRLPTLSDLKRELANHEETKQLSDVLEIFTGEGTLSLFDCQSSVDIQEKDRIIGFNLKEFDKDEFLKFFASVVIMNWIWNKFSHERMKKRKKMVMFDEAWMFTKYESSNDYLESLSRRGRKYRISLMVASQTILEFLRTDAGRTMLNMCHTKFLLKQEPDLASETAEYFKLSDAARNFLITANKGQAILVNPLEKVALQITPFSFEWDYVTTTNF
ncbi:VirB4 family type IV secretion system protein [Anaerocellum danielii]|uniref:ATP-binding protein n=1 Tax=Anaerocellum danielii TaxID=1387557 RepID=A0ABZ0U1C1_9FIRM|nr:ATP-binding protein [Caldicellulosiruptor danielii]WPX08219.1 ATP-binding protein [Caldicellulosiruptor danielii]